MRQFILYIIILCLLPVCLYAQEEGTTAFYGRKYLDINIKAGTTFNQKAQKQQQKLLKKLKRKEVKLAKQLKKNDSAAYAKYKASDLTYDSISKVSASGSKNNVTKHRRSTHNGIDSLNGVKKFLEEKAHVTGESASSEGYGDKIATLDANNEHTKQVSDLISQRTNYLKYVTNGSKLKNKGSLKSILKQEYYSGQKISVLKGAAEHPSVAEEKALEYLQGKEGFNESLSSSTAGSMQGMNSGNMSVADLEKMGYQTKQYMSKHLKGKLGSNLSGVQESMSGQISEYTDKLKEVKDAKNTAQQTKQSVRQLKQTPKPDFKINPMRGLPFKDRIELQYNWQTNRATVDGKPAIVHFSVMAGLKHTPRLSYGLGIASSTGLGKNWNNITFSFEGVGLRSYAAWQWQYGIGAYAGYERTFKKAVFVTKDNPNIPEELPYENNHDNINYRESVLLGLTKAYRINDKWNGSIQVLYDIWWKDKGLRSPIQLRFATMKN